MPQMPAQKKQKALEKSLREVEGTLEELKKQFVAIRDVVIDNTLTSGEEFICPICRAEFMEFIENNEPFMRCPKCKYAINFEKL